MYSGVAIFINLLNEVSKGIDEVRRERRSAILALTGLILCAILAADVTLAVGRVQTDSLCSCSVLNSDFFSLETLAKLECHWNLSINAGFSFPSSSANAV